MGWCTGDPFYDGVLAGALGLAGLVAVSAPFVASPYGRFGPAAGSRWAVSPRLGWFLMELPATLVFVSVFLWIYLNGPRRGEPVPLVFFGIWMLHYANRGFLFPLRMRVPAGQPPTFGALVLGAGWVVTTLHGYLNAAFFARHGAHYTPAWLLDPRFLGGLALYLASYALNLHSDAVLRRLRTPAELASGERVYRIPRGGLFRWVSSPSYLTELTAWAGFALAAWSPAGVFILAVSAANLIPRAASTHRWYRERFPDYPKERRALVPFVW